jgi:hypothetical protein
MIMITDMATRATVDMVTADMVTARTCTTRRRRWRFR